MSSLTLVDKLRTIAKPSSSPLSSAAVAILQQGLQLLNDVPQADYARALPVAFNATIGGHYRHCLEHFEALIAGSGKRLVDYDARKRDREVETSVAAARERTESLIEGLNSLLGDFPRPVQVRCKVNYEEVDSGFVESSMEREVMYAVVHAVHHFALIRFMANLLGLTLPDHFGKAPSTCHFERGSTVVEEQV